MKTLDSKIVNVTVFTDRAQIFRTSEVELIDGEQTLRFDNLPERIEPKSIQVNGRGPVILKNIKFKEVYYEEETNLDKKQLKVEIKSIENKLEEILDTIENVKKEKQFIENIAKKAVHTNENSQNELNPENWIKMAEFYRTKLSELGNEIREQKSLLENQKAKQKKLKRELSQLGSLEGKSKNVVDVVVSVTGDSSVEFSLSYIVYGVSWNPIYNMRVSSENKKMLLEYNANITQNTGESWENIFVKLSTAQVQIAGTLPEISPWLVDIYTPPVIRPASPKKYKKERTLAKSMVKDDNFGAMDEGIFDEEEAKFVPTTKVKPGAKLEQKETSTVFTANGKYTILSDNLDYTVTLLLEEFDTDFLHFSAPKLSPVVYLTAMIENTSAFPLLSGYMNIFFDSSFVAESFLKTVMPNDKFELSLGADEGVKATHKLVSKYNKHEGIFTKKNIVIFEYQTVIKNTKQTEILLTLKENMPVSRTDKISVELILPKYKEDSEELSIDKQGVITQKIQIAPAEEKTLYLKFEVEYQKDIIVTGL